MARLTIEQVKAPDFSASSEMLARANESFNRGLDSAKSILGDYDAGQKAKNDNLILNDIAKLDSEEALNEYLASDKLQGLNISDTMRETVLGLRSDVLGYAQNRANTTNTIDGNNRANAAEGRTAAEYIDGVNARTERRGLTAAVVANEEEGRRYGQNGPTSGASGIRADNPVYSDFMGTIQAAGVTNPYALAAIAATGSHESGFSEKNATGSWSDPSESGRPGTAGGIMSWNNDRFENMRRFTGGDLSGSAQAKFFLQEDPQLIAALQGAKSAAEATTLMNNAWRFAGYDRPGGEASRRIQTAEGLVGNFADGATLPITQNAPGGSANNALRTAISNSLYLEPDQAIGLLETGYVAQREGQALIDAAEGRRQSELMAAATRDSIFNPNNQSETAVRGDLAYTPGLSAANSLAAAGQDLSVFSGNIAPVLRPDSEVDAALARTAPTESGDDIFALAKSFDGGPNTSPLGPMFKELGESTKMTLGQVRSYDNALTQLAEKAGVSTTEAAAALATLGRVNGIDVRRALEMSSDEGGYGDIVDLIEKEVGPEAKAAYEASQAEKSRKTADRESAQLQYSAARTRAAKLPVGSDERRAADAEVAAIRDTMLKGMTPAEREQNLVDYISKTGMGSRLQGLDPESPEFFRAMAQLEETIKADSSLTETEKELLLKDIRG